MGGVEEEEEEETVRKEAAKQRGQTESHREQKQSVQNGFKLPSGSGARKSSGGSSERQAAESS